MQVVVAARKSNLNSRAHHPMDATGWESVFPAMVSQWSGLSLASADECENSYPPSFSNPPSIASMCRASAMGSGITRPESRTNVRTSVVLSSRPSPKAQPSASRCTLSKFEICTSQSSSSWGSANRSYESTYTRVYHTSISSSLAK